MAQRPISPAGKIPLATVVNFSRLHLDCYSESSFKSGRGLRHLQDAAAKSESSGSRESILEDRESATRSNFVSPNASKMLKQHELIDSHGSQTKRSDLINTPLQRGDKAIQCDRKQL